MYNANSFDLVVERSYPTPFQNSSLLPLLLMSLAMQKHTPDTKRSFRREYDYIVVGAGSAGCVVAARLSEDPSKTVLLLEAGKSPPLITDLPAAQPSFEGSDITWGYSTEPQKYAAWGHVNRRVTSPTGKTVGGSSTINGMFYVRGNRADYDEWEELGAHGWDWGGVFPYFLKSENNTDPDIAHNGFHSVGGPLSVGRFPTESEYEVALKKTLFSVNYPLTDINGKRQSGFADMQANVRNGQRVSTAKAYLVPNENRSNLDIVVEAYVTKVLIANKRAWGVNFDFEGRRYQVLIANKTARGVNFDFEGRRYQVRAKSEVILSAGALKTPQLLMLSGIGPRNILETFGIPVIADLPVGKNLYDHGGSGVNFYTNKDLPTLIEKLQNSDSIREYINHRTGPLATLIGYFGMAFLSNNVTAQRLDLPEYQLYFFEGQWGALPPYGVSQEVYDKLYGPYLDKPTIYCLSQDLAPLSKGYVSIRSKNPYDPPVVDPNYFEFREDVLRVVDGIKKCYRIMESSFMKEFGFKPFETLMPGCEELLDHDEYLECYARTIVVPVSHQVGTARMGDICDPNAVVDTHLRVKGIKGLRVVDASVMPTLPRANTNNPVIMIAEEASDMIMGESPMYRSDTDEDCV